jgi:spermidine synthase
MTSPTPRPATIAGPRTYADLFLISFVILFFQLACIRWFGSTVVFMTFFTNVVLMACFLGMSVGCLTASRKQDYVHTVIPLALLTIVLSYAVLAVHTRFGNRIVIDVGGQASPQEIFFGTEYSSNDPSRFFIPIEAVAGLFFVLIAVMFVGLGQVMGRAFDRIPNRIAAYTTNIVGSLIGIFTFAAASYFHTTPLLWFGVSLAITLHFVRSQRSLQVLALGCTLGVLLVTFRADERYQAQSFWSPYYKIRYESDRGRINTNNIGHQRMVRVEESGAAYVLPHLLNRDAGGQPFNDILIIGAGSGNDVQAALAHGARHVDAVEIDPVIYEIGRRDHPDRPYADPRVLIHLDDGRSFLRKTTKQYDLIVYALVDSLVLHSGYSSLRLESFLFTNQAFEDVKRKLKPGGIFVMYNFYRQGWVIGRLDKLAEATFGSKPMVISLPYQNRIAATESQGGHFTLLFAGDRDSTVIQSIRTRFDDATFFWLHRQPRQNSAVGFNGYGSAPPDVAGTQPQDWQRIGPASLDTAAIDQLPSDDWPFLYLREPTVPALNLRGMLVMAVLSTAVLVVFAPVRTLKPNGQMFFLGAGFMLLETKGVVHLALLFGATWVVNSIVFFTVLVMILMSNVYVSAVRPKAVWPYYSLLIGSLVLNAYVPMSTFLTLPGATKVIVSCIVVFAPIFFAGIIFATAFRDSLQPDVDFGSNIGGVILGGLSEYLSLMVGFRYLLVVALVFYLASLWLRPRTKLVPSASVA